MSIVIKCKACGCILEFPASVCPACKSSVTLTELDLRKAEEDIKAAMKSREYESAVLGYRALADLGLTSAQVEYARILEEGELVPKNLDLAMKYFSLAARARDPYGAYRYSRLLSRDSDAGGVFYLEYSAYLGCKDAYAAVAAHYSSVGEEALATYYYSLLAELDDTAAIVTVARRYYDGVGAPASAECARWYMDKLLLPPFHAIKLAYKLRQVKPREPKIEKPRSYCAILPRLAKEAKRLGFLYAYNHIVDMLSESDVNMMFTLGTLYAEGVGCEVSARRAIAALENAGAHGVADAFKYLGDIYLEGRLVARDVLSALECYKSAADNGKSSAYEIMGDIFYEGKLIGCDIRTAIELYELAAAESVATASEKADRLKREREGLYKSGEEKIRSSPEEGFRLIAISAGMGYLPAYRRLAECYLFGEGIKRSRRAAYYWYKTLDEEGIPGAAYDLALCYSRGIGMSFDFNAACELLKKALTEGDERASTELERLLENKKRHMEDKLFSTAMRLLYNKNTAPAKEMLEALRAAGHAKGTYTLGCMYEFGIGTPTDRTLAFSLYEIAYAKKFRDPRQVYKLRVLKMIR